MSTDDPRAPEGATAEVDTREPTPRDSAEGPPPGTTAMAIVRWLLVVLMAAVAVASIGHYAGWFEGSDNEADATEYYCPMHPGVVQDHPGDCPICSMTLVPKPHGGSHEHGQEHAATTGEYYCPMHPEVTSNDPNATCAKCNGMKLVPKPAPAGTSAAAAAKSAVPGLVPIQLTSDRIQLTGMRTAPVQREVLARELRAVATIAPSEKGLAVVQVRFAGWIEKLFVEQTGERVSKGQVLASIYGPDVLPVQQEYLNALKWSTGQSATSGPPGVTGTFKDDARQRLELLGISKSEIEEIERTGEPLRALQVRSPVAGYVSQKNAVQGLYVQPGTPLFEIANLATIGVLADIPEHEVARVRLGQKAKLELAAFAGESFAGRVAFIYPTLDPSTRTLRIRMEFLNKDLRLKPGMYGNVQVALDGADGLVVPREALVDTGTLQYVFVAKDGGRFEPRRVKVGARTSDKVQILEGVVVGEIVVTTANFLIDSESRLRATIEGVAAAPELEDVAPPAPAASPSVPSDSSAPKPVRAPRPAQAPQGGVCETQFDRERQPDKYQQCRACAVHRGMGAMEQDCINAIAKPWK